MLFRLRKELFAWTDNKIAVQFWYEYFDESEQSWFRCYGLGKNLNCIFQRTRILILWEF